jgi:hypothetical protein
MRRSVILCLPTGLKALPSPVCPAVASSKNFYESTLARLISEGNHLRQMTAAQEI